MRFLFISFALMLVAFLVPGFSIRSYTAALLTVSVMAALAALTESLLNKPISLYTPNFIGLLVTALILYISQFIIHGVRITLIASLVASMLLTMLLPLISRGDLLNGLKNNGQKSNYPSKKGIK
ncbi:hypothetical protein BEP19_05170 [Ammoniphilus oxalaticus]|uniref:Phage holin family protein n=2 Tax=Ammoniphilus oxalaticus TaxID=66863 RepID=A0A419SIH8_9BACL|nr:hypothetical protein BEP19_05170 [Ammoniphilus oxalaticus]